MARHTEYTIGEAIARAYAKYGPQWYELVTLTYHAGTGYLVCINRRPSLFSY